MKDLIPWWMWLTPLLVGLIVGLVALFTGLASGQMCGDCNNDGRVAVNEIVTAVNTALDPCNFGCGFNPDDCTVGRCTEQPIVDGQQCQVSLCAQSDTQADLCARLFKTLHPESCFNRAPVGEP